MAKQTQDREDLLRDGTAMPVRGRLMINDREIVIGFRNHGQLSLYWDQDPVFQFDVDGRLRRVFYNSKRLKADRGHLVNLVRDHHPQREASSRLTLQSKPISCDEETAILRRLLDCLQQIDSVLRDVDRAVASSGLKTVGADAVDFCRRVREWIQHAGCPILVAART